MHQRFLTGMQTLLMALLAVGAQASSTHTAVPAQQHPGMNGLYKSKSLPKAGYSLNRAFGEYRAHVAKGSQVPFRPSNQFLQFSIIITDVYYFSIKMKFYASLLKNIDN